MGRRHHQQRDRGKRRRVTRRGGDMETRQVGSFTVSFRGVLGWEQRVERAVVAGRPDRARRHGRSRRGGVRRRGRTARRRCRWSRQSARAGTVTTASCTSCSSRRSAPSAVLAWMVPTPPGWPVPQALSRSSASLPRTSPIGMRSGRRRSDDFTRSESEATPSLVRSATRFGAAHCSSRVSSISTTRSEVFATSASKAFVSVVLPVEVPPATRMFLRRSTASLQHVGLRRGHDAGGNIIGRA
jgi:hypothetical protein